MLYDPDPPELGNEDPEFLALLGLARDRTASVVYLIASDPPRAGDPDDVAEAKAVLVAEAWAQRRGAAFGGIIPAGQQARKHEFARAMVAAVGPEYVRMAEATMVAMPEREAADRAEEAFHHAEREARSLEKELFAWQSILNSVRAMYVTTGVRG